MKIRGLYTMDKLPGKYIVDISGRYYYFDCAPYRQINAEDLHPLAIAAGLYPAATDKTLYRHYCSWYGLELDDASIKETENETERI